MLPSISGCSRSLIARLKSFMLTGDSIPITPRGLGCIYDEKALGCLMSFPICLIGSSHDPADVTSVMAHTLVADGTVPAYSLNSHCVC